MFWLNTDYNLLFFVLCVVSLVHVYKESKRLKDAPIRNVLMVAICLWPLGYLLWLFYWPGTLLKWLRGKEPLQPATAILQKR